MENTMNTGFLFGLALGGALFLGTTVSAVLGPGQGGQSEVRPTSKDEHYLKDLASATTQWKLETESERLIGRLFPAYGEVLGRDYIQQAVSRAQADGKLEREIYFGFRIDHPYYSDSEIRDLLSRLVASSDVVVRCEVVSKTSQLSSDGSFALTKYDVKITELLKQGRTAQLRLGDTIRVVRPGGMLLIDGTVISVRANSYLPFGSDNYLLLLERDESTGCYVPSGSRHNLEPILSSYATSDGNLHPLAEGLVLPPTMRTVESVKALIRVIEPESSALRP
jgi:hypothetical protein